MQAIEIWPSKPTPCTPTETSDMTDEQATGLCGKLEVNEQQPLCLYLSTSRFTSVATRAPATNQSYLVDLSAEKEVVSIRNNVMLELLNSLLLLQYMRCFTSFFRHALQKNSWSMFGNHDGIRTQAVKVSLSKALLDTFW